ncbi:Tyrosine protein kinase:Serine/threonine protein kinase [[Actinomadura] parvosata subsp. kistnae]|uniref:Serine/threonine protein kinase n=1 Tax=[Actinomadura] parvosata subsp. kistnae TaxID=1909395 RepID=A0A1V0AFW6_9ACTN|nr:serine/threonine-protein kinase [Nonomuraea sp. ATCC 55076]AQZ69069.1 serine/threonine protein kinase [Nonomuraea sp. ATCC 55076]SPL92353.1 Tyrosine protein kinase:Serine/threonine protein kinase [Actinomadura parvosata subsp. kistnae]
MSTQAPERLGPYRLVRKIGEGGMGVVHLGLDGEGREVAIKVLHPHVAADLKARDRLTREVETMRRVRSPFVAEVIDAELVGSQPYVVTRFAPGRTLEDTVLSEGPLEARQVIQLTQGLCQALVAIHAADVIHRDFKPSNVMLVDGRPLVIDFGIAHLVNATRLTQTGMFVGTPGYLAPEIIRDSEITQAADVHALASTVFFAATGAPPFGTGTFESVCFNIMEGRAQIDKAPAWLRGWLTRALQVEPSLRPGAQELLRLAKALDPAVTTFNEGPTGTKRIVPRTRTMDTFSDLLPPVEYGQAAPPPPAPSPTPTRQEERPARREERPPPYVPAPMPARPAPHPDQRVAGHPPPDRRLVPKPTAPSQVRPYTPPPQYTPPSERKRYLFGSQVVGLLLLVTLVAVTVMMPVMAGAVAVALALVLRLGEYLFGDLVKRRQTRGSSAADPLLALVGTPWALVKSALVTAVHVPLSLLFGVCVWGVLYWAGKMGVNEAAAYAAGAFAAGLFVLPGGGAPRKAVTRTLTGVLRSPGAALVAVVLVGTAALFAVMFALGQDPTWAPWRAPESVINDLASDARQSTIGLITGLIGDLLDRLGLGWLNPWS